MLSEGEPPETRGVVGTLMSTAKMPKPPTYACELEIATGPPRARCGFMMTLPASAGVEGELTSITWSLPELSTAKQVPPAAARPAKP